LTAPALRCAGMTTRTASITSGTGSCCSRRPRGQQPHDLPPLPQAAHRGSDQAYLGLVHREEANAPRRPRAHADPYEVPEVREVVQVSHSSPTPWMLMNTNMRLYLIRGLAYGVNGPRAWLKIGITTNPRRRIGHLRSTVRSIDGMQVSWESVQWVYVLKGQRCHEQSIIARFRHLHTNPAAKCCEFFWEDTAIIHALRSLRLKHDPQHCPCEICGYKPETARYASEERNAAIFTMFHSGITQGQIATEFAISRQRVSQIVLAQERSLEIISSSCPKSI
jgi:hypothetical protein